LPTFLSQIKDRFTELRELEFIDDRKEGFRKSWHDDQYLGLLGLGNSLHKNFQKYGADYREEAKSFGLRWHSNSSV
jgi:hypothetical protein